MREALWLVKNGVPFAAAFGLRVAEAAVLRLDAIERMAFSIVLSEFEGNEFDWQSMEFKNRK